jgi:hypothetical protein
MQCFIKGCKNEPNGFIHEGKFHIAWCAEHEKIVDEALEANDDGETLSKIYEQNKGNN